LADLSTVSAQTTERITARSALKAAAESLRSAGALEPEACAEVLLAELTGLRRTELRLRDPELSPDQVEAYGAWISARRQRRPVQRILGYAYFRNLKLYLNHETLIPRPETESVVDAALECVDGRGGRCRVLDLGTGSGAIALSIVQERPACTVYATDVSEIALEAARRNASEAQVEVEFLCTDLMVGLEELEGSVDILVSNPPYIPGGRLPGLMPEVRDWDPVGALDGGPDGLVFYRRIFREAAGVLRPGADVVLEVGDGQAGEVAALARGYGYEVRGTRPDLTGVPRAVVLRWSG
jgi:release factor glutamine methyltransferase